MAIAVHNEYSTDGEVSLPPHIERALKRAGTIALKGFRHMAGAETFKEFDERSISNLVRGNLEAGLRLSFKGVLGAATKKVRNSFVADVTDANGKLTRWIFRLADDAQRWVSVPKSVSSANLAIRIAHEETQDGETQLPLPRLLDGVEERHVLVCLYLRDSITYQPQQFVLNQQVGKVVNQIATVAMGQEIIEYPEEEVESGEIEFDFAPSSDDHIISIDLDEPDDNDIEITGTSTDERDGTNDRDDDMEVHDKDIG